jgi:hypothetical protein
MGGRVPKRGVPCIRSPYQGNFGPGGWPKVALCSDDDQWHAPS